MACGAHGFIASLCNFNKEGIFLLGQEGLEVPLAEVDGVLLGLLEFVEWELTVEVVTVLDGDDVAAAVFNSGHSGFSVGENPSRKLPPEIFGFS